MRTYADIYLEYIKKFEGKHPAYNRTKNIEFYFCKPGLYFKFVTEPYFPFNQLALHDFELFYDPGLFSPWSIIKKTLGKKPLNYTRDDLRFVSHSTVILNNDQDSGKAVEFFLRFGHDVERKIDNGPLLIVFRDTGKVYFKPADKKGVLGFLSGVTSELRNGFGPKHWNTGMWCLADD
ncbi:MAG: hypothetical protein DWQ19_12140 [Crenarchaeota archaeon]|nr:MAG: hypothetical protein DWQ19_12140 [Thermoproteota archaeon]